MSLSTIIWTTVLTLPSWREISNFSIGFAFKTRSAVIEILSSTVFTTGSGSSLIVSATFVTSVSSMISFLSFSERPILVLVSSMMTDFMSSSCNFFSSKIWSGTVWRIRFIWIWSSVTTFFAGILIAEDTFFATVPITPASSFSSGNPKNCVGLIFKIFIPEKNKKSTSTPTKHSGYL